MPIYQLLGGKVREAADCYTHASGAEYAETIAMARKFMDQGFRHVRVQVGVPGMEGYGSRRGRPRSRRCTAVLSSSHSSTFGVRLGFSRRVGKSLETRLNYSMTCTSA